MTITLNGSTGITSPAVDVTTPITVADGGTGSTTAADARTALSAAKSGANSDITSITGLTTALSVVQGGTGLTSVGASGNVLTSDGTSWVSSAPSGGVTSFNGNTGALAGWQLVTSGTFTSASTINITGLPSGYKVFKIIVFSSCVAGSTATYGMRISTNNGSSYLSTAIYNSSTSGSGSGALNEVLFLPVSYTTVTSGDKFYYNFDLIQSSNGQNTSILGTSGVYTASTSQLFSFPITGYITNTAYVNAIQLVRSAGTTTQTGFYQIYGSQ